MKDKIQNLLTSLDMEQHWLWIAIVGIKVLGYGLLAIVTAIEEK